MEEELNSYYQRKKSVDKWTPICKIDLITHSPTDTNDKPFSRTIVTKLHQNNFLYSMGKWNKKLDFEEKTDSNVLRDLTNTMDKTTVKHSVSKLPSFQNWEKEKVIK